MPAPKRSPQTRLPQVAPPRPPPAPLLEDHPTGPPTRQPRAGPKWDTEKIIFWIFLVLLLVLSVIAGILFWRKLCLSGSPVRFRASLPIFAAQVLPLQHGR